MKKIDIHAHVTNRPLPGILQKSANIDTLLEEMGLFDVEQTMVLASYFPHKGSGISNYRMFHWVKDHPNLDMFGSLDFEHYFYQGLNELDELADAGVLKGIKIYTCYQNIKPDGEKINKVFDLAEDYNLPVMFHLGHAFRASRVHGSDAHANYVLPMDIYPLAFKYSHVPIIVAHLAKPDHDNLIQLVQMTDNVQADMSGLVESGNQTRRPKIPSFVDAVTKYLEHCGPTKLLFGTDFPVQTHEDSVYFVEQAMQGFSEEDKKLVYYDNARRLLK